MNIQRAFLFDNPIDYLRAGSGHVRSWSVLRSSNIALSLFVILEFVLAIAAGINLWTTICNLSVKTNYAVGCSDNVATLSWTSTAIALHIIGKITFDLRAKTLKLTSAIRKKHSRILIWAKDEFTMCAKQQRAHLESRDETYLFILFSWLTSLLIIGHLLYGSMAFSALIFIGI